MRFARFLGLFVHESIVVTHFLGSDEAITIPYHATVAFRNVCTLDRCTERCMANECELAYVATTGKRVRDSLSD